MELSFDNGFLSPSQFTGAIYVNCENGVRSTRDAVHLRGAGCTTECTLRQYGQQVFFTTDVLLQ